MEQVRHDTATEYNGKRYESPKARMVSVKAQGLLCISNPSLNGYGEGSHSNGGEMG